MKRDSHIPGQYSIDFFSEETESAPASPSYAAEPEEDELQQLARVRNNSIIKYICFGSGSSGNSCYIGTQRGGVIIDAGVAPDLVSKALRDNGIPERMVKGILLTHDHSDHVRFAYKYLRAFPGTALFCTNRVLTGILRRHNVSKRIKDYHRAIFKEIPFRVLDFEITAFDTPHDGTDNMGFNLNFEDRNFVLATDLGAVTERARHYMSSADYLVIEANYDDRMLEFGPYPQYLKARIRTERGHMDNLHTANFLKEIAGGRLRYVFLCHLSKDNNTPEKAIETVRGALEEKGLRVGDATESIEDRRSDIHLMALPRYEPTRVFLFRP